MVSLTLLLTGAAALLAAAAPAEDHHKKKHAPEIHFVGCPDAECTSGDVAGHKMREIYKKVHAGGKCRSYKHDAFLGFYYNWARNPGDVVCAVQVFDGMHCEGEMLAEIGHVSFWTFLFFSC